jgi:hypothetical protein
MEGVGHNKTLEVLSTKRVNTLSGVEAAAQALAGAGARFQLTSSLFGTKLIYIRAA